MKSKPLMLLLVAAGCGLVAMLGVQQMLSGGKQDAAKIRIVVARMEIRQGIQLDSTNVVMKEWPQDNLPEGAVTSEEQYLERALKHQIGPGQPILLSELGNKGEYGLDIKIPPEMRVVSVPVTATMTHSGLLKPGNFVDVNAAVEVQQGKQGKPGDKRTEVRSVLQCIQVFAIDSQVVGTEESKDPKAKDSKVASFLVYPNQAKLLYLAEKRSNGGLQFLLRSSSDKSIVNSGDLDEDSMSSISNSLFGQKEEPERNEVVVERPDTEKPVPMAKTNNAFRNFVAPETSSAVISVGDQAARRTWTMVIYQGEEKEVVELDWPEDDPADAKRTPGDAAIQFSDPPVKSGTRPQKDDAASSGAAQPR